MNRSFAWKLLRHLTKVSAKAHDQRAHKLTLETLEDRSTPSVAPINLHSIARDDWADTDGNNPVAVSVLENDSPSQAFQAGRPVTLLSGTILIRHAPVHGRVSVDRRHGLITYTARGNFTGTDSFQYSVIDSRGAISNRATVNIRINRPTAADDWTDTDGSNPVAIAVLENDTDPDGNEHIQFPGSVSMQVGPLHGHVTLNAATNEFTYTANAGFTGTDKFTYKVTDDAGAASAPGNVFIRVNRPTAANDLASFDGPTPIAIDVLENDTDPDGNEHILPGSVTITSAPLHGTATVDLATGLVTYIANAGFSGTDSLKYTIADDAGAVSAPGMVTVSGFKPLGVNDDSIDTDGTNPVAVPVLANDIGAGGMVPGSVVVVTRPPNGTVSVDRTTGDITYTAKAGFTGTDTFRYQARDAAGRVGSATVSVRVNRPVAADDWIDTDGTNPVTVAVLENDTDPDGNQHIHFPGSVSLVSSPLHGTVSLDSATNSFTYTALGSFTGTDSFKYIVTDDAGASSMPATVFVRVNRPVAGDDFATAHGTNPVVIAVLENDTDPDGNQHIQYAGSVSLLTGPAHGTVTLNSATNTFTYTAAVGFSGTDRFQYIVTDDAGASSAPATVVVTVETPVVASTNLVLNGSFAVINIANTATHPEGPSALVGAHITLVTPPIHGQAAVDQINGLIVYTPFAGFMGTDDFTYTVTDIFGVTSAPASVHVSILRPI